MRTLTLDFFIKTNFSEFRKTNQLTSGVLEYTLFAKHFIHLHKRENLFCQNPNDNITQHNLNTVVGLDTKMTVQTPPYPTTTNPPHKLNVGSRSLRTRFIDDN